MTEEKHTSRKTRVNPLIVFLQKGLYKGARRDGELALASGSPVSPGSRSFWGGSEELPWRFLENN